MVSEKGVAEAFYFFADENAVIRRENDTLVKGKENIRNYLNNKSTNKSSLEWTPDFIGVSASGDLGYTYGVYVLRTENDQGEPLEYRGVFHTIWKRQRDGSWRFVGD